DQCKTTGNAAADVLFAHRAALHENTPRSHAVAAHHAFEEFAAPRPHQAIEADNLARADRQRNVVNRVASGEAWKTDVLRPERLAAETVIARGRKVLGVRTDHLPDDPVKAGPLHRAGAGDPPVSQHGDEIADAHQLLEPV